MRKYFIVIGMLAGVSLLYNCGSSKKTTASKPAVSNYESDVKAVVEAKCSPCHIPAKGGNKRSYDNFANVKTDIDEIIRRIELNPGERGYMPFRQPKLNDSTIAVFKKWKTDGMIEK